jgi:hypothetical protein
LKILSFLKNYDTKVGKALMVLGQEFTKIGFELNNLYFDFMRKNKLSSRYDDLCFKRLILSCQNF